MMIKIIYQITAVAFCVISCTAHKKNQSNDFFVKEDDFLKAYKTAFVAGCLNEGTNGNFYKFLNDNNDLGLFTEGDLISHFRVNEADSLGRVYAKRIKTFTYGDGRGKVPNFSGCMHFAFSNEVDSIAKRSYMQTL
jgi:hypothetical protein